MNEFQRLCALLKVCYENLLVLHHNLVRDPAWKGNHEWLGDWYDMTAEQADDLVEIGLQLGYKEPTIAESLMMFPALTADDRQWPETQTLVMGMFTALMEQLDKAQAGNPDCVINKLQEYQYAWRKEMYKLGHAMGTTTPEEDD